MLAALVNNESTTSVAAAYRAGYMPSSTTPPKPSPTALFRQLGLCSGADLLALTAHNVTSVIEITNLFLPHLARSPSGAACVVNLVSPRCSTAEAAKSTVRSLSTMAFDASQAALAMVCAYQTAHLSACASPLRSTRLIWYRPHPIERRQSRLRTGARSLRRRPQRRSGLARRRLALYGPLGRAPHAADGRA